MQRILLVQLVIFLSDIIASTTYLFITHGSMIPKTIGADNIAHVSTVYVVIILIAVPLFQFVIALCHRFDGLDDAPIQSSIIILALGSVVMFTLTYLRFISAGTKGIAYAATSLAFCWLTVVIDCLIFASVMIEYNARKELVHHAAATRQAKHERIEIESITRRATALYELRHSLANQMRAITNLAETKRYSEADSRLSIMQKQAHMLAEEADKSKTSLPSHAPTSSEPPMRVDL